MHQPEIGIIVDLLRHEHDAVIHQEVQGRIHLSLPRLEVFIGIDLESAARRRPELEAPLVLSAICGMEMTGSVELHERVEQFRAASDPAADLLIEIVHGVGLQVWLDRVVDDVTIRRIGLDGLLVEFLASAHELQRALGPLDRNPPRVP